MTINKVATFVSSSFVDTHKTDMAGRDQDRAVNIHYFWFHMISN